MRLSEVELHDPDVYVRGVPHDALRLLRAEAPVHFHPEPGGPGFWVVSKYEDYPPENLSTIQLLMLNMDPPQHNKFRRLVSQGFTPRMVGKLEARIHDVARTIIDKIADRGECDFVRTVAAELPLQVITELLGIPVEDRGKVFDWSNRLIGFDDPEFQTSLEDGTQAAFEMWNYANEVAESRKGKSGDDLVSVLVNAEVDGIGLTEMEFDAFFLLLSVAGNETTRNLISGGMLALLEHPEQRARLLADPSLVSSAVEEMLRWVTPVMYFRRTATRDTELRGTPIKENQKVCVYYNSANRDEDVFPDGDRFDVGRTPNEHLAFGVGQHFCLGTSLARLEIKAMFEELLRRLPDIELAGPVRRLRSNFINGYKQIPVRFTPEKRA
jgi:cholest-4-en-3-one 26-monooxygenase